MTSTMMMLITTTTMMMTTIKYDDMMMRIMMMTMMIMMIMTMITMLMTMMIIRMMMMMMTKTTTMMMITTTTTIMMMITTVTMTMMTTMMMTTTTTTTYDDLFLSLAKDQEPPSPYPAITQLPALSAAAAAHVYINYPSTSQADNHASTGTCYQVGFTLLTQRRILFLFGEGVGGGVFANMCSPSFSECQKNPVLQISQLDYNQHFFLMC
jgi:hypothetical protein